MTHHVRLEMLVGRKVLGITGESVGRVEEITANVEGGTCLIDEVHVGGYALLERLSAWFIGRAILELFGARRGGASYRVPWDRMDLSDPERPRLTCDVSELPTQPCKSRAE
jgi:sporulation protein YlmC with PRC-barrel domain